MCDILGTDGDDDLQGSPAAEVICGLGGNDLLTGGNGDTLIGGPGDNQLDAGPSDCAIPGDSVTDKQRHACDSVKTFTRAVERSREYAVPPPGGGPGGPDTPRGYGPVGGGAAPGVVSETTGAGQVYVALSRYLRSDDGEGAPASAIAEILTSAYEDGQIRLLLRCAYAGKGRVVLTVLDKNGNRVKLGAAGFYCTREDDALTVTVRVSDRGRRLLAESSRVRIKARVIDPALDHQPRGSTQSFELSP